MLVSDALQVLGNHLQANPAPAQAAVLAQSQSFKSGHWRPRAGGNDPDVLWCLNRFPGVVSRNDILAIPRLDPRSTQAEVKRRVLIGSLMWGLGTQAARLSWPGTIDKVLADPSLSTQLSQCSQALTADLKTAFTVATQWKGLGVAFASKYLYFMGRVLGVKDYPLILDQFVVRSLALLTGFGLIVDVPMTPSRSAGRYAAFVGTIHGWAQSLGVEAEVIEYVLWEQARRPQIEVAAHAYF